MRLRAIASLATGFAVASGWLAVGVEVALAAVVRSPPANGAFDYQLGGAYPPPAGTQIVTRDRGASPLPGAYSICYVNAFQTQPDELAWWRGHHRALLLRRHGREVHDPGWPGEVLLDTSTARKRAAIAEILGRWIDRCALDGFQAVEPDNLDSWTRSHGSLTGAGNFALARHLIARAHAAGLAIGQKNTAERTASGRRAGFDFAVAESCQRYAECGAYTDAYGSEVLEVEYSDEAGERGFAAACRARGATISINYRDHDLTTPDKPGYIDRAC
jgi:hypothetical protein